MYGSFPVTLLPLDRQRLLRWIGACRRQCWEYKEDLNIPVSATRTPVQLLFDGNIEYGPFFL